MQSPLRNDSSPIRMAGALGPQIITAGGFPDLSGFTLNANATGVVSAVGGELVYSAPHGDYAAATAIGKVVIGATYEYAFTINPKPSATAFYYIYGGGVLLQASNCNGAAPGERSGRFKATSQVPFSISVRTDGAIGLTGVSVRRVR